LDKISVRQFEKKDIEFAYEMTTVEHWNVTVKDVERMYSFEPEGCFMAEVNGEPAGHAFAFNYGTMGWIGLVIVKDEHRRKGLATLLTAKARDYLLNRGVATIKLEAVPAISGLYRKLGFTDEFDSLRFIGTRPATACLTSCNTKPVEDEIVEELARIDARYFGARRTKVLEALFKEYPQYCFVSRSGSRIDGYIMCRNAEKGYNLGPWACDPSHPETAKELLATCVSRLTPGAKIYVGVPSVNCAATVLLNESGFKMYSKSIRMRFGNELKDECAAGIFAIGGPMKG